MLVIFDMAGWRLERWRKHTTWTRPGPHQLVLGRSAAGSRSGLKAMVVFDKRVSTSFVVGCVQMEWPKVAFLRVDEVDGTSYLRDDSVLVEVCLGGPFDLYVSVSTKQLKPT